MTSPKAAHTARARASARLAAVQALYQRSMKDVAIRPLLREFHHHRLGAEIEGVDYAEADADLFDRIVSGVDERQAELDALIAARLSKGWSLPRLDRPLAAILRAGAWSWRIAPTRPAPRSSPPISTSPTPSTARRRRASPTPSWTRWPGRAAGGRRGSERSGTHAPRAPASAGAWSFAGAQPVVSREAEFHRLLTAHALDPAARGLMDDAAVLDGLSGRSGADPRQLVEGVHCRADDPPESYGLEAGGGQPLRSGRQGCGAGGCLLSYTLGEEAWNARFLEGLFACLDEYGMPLIGGDTVRLPQGSARVFGLTAIGRAPGGGAPSRHGWAGRRHAVGERAGGRCGVGAGDAGGPSRAPAKAGAQCGFPNDDRSQGGEREWLLLPQEHACGQEQTCCVAARWLTPTPPPSPPTASRAPTSRSAAPSRVRSTR